MLYKRLTKLLNIRLYLIFVEFLTHNCGSVARSWDFSQFWGFLDPPVGFFFSVWEIPENKSLLRDFFFEKFKIFFFLNSFPSQFSDFKCRHFRAQKGD